MSLAARIGAAGCAAALAGGTLAAAPLRVIALGTSLTASGGWTRPLGEALARRRGGDAVAVMPVARAGANSDWLLGQIPRVAAARPDIVLVESAANDAALHRGMTIARSRANLRAIVAGLRGRLPGVRIVVMAMNPVHGLRGLVRWRLDDYADAHLAEAGALGVEHVDFRPAWRRLPPEAIRAAIPDGLHPRPDAAARVMVPPLAACLAAAMGRCR